MIRFSITAMLLALTGILGFQAQAAPSIAEQVLSNNGGDGVAINGEWAFVGDSDLCNVSVYKYDYTTNLWGDGAASPTADTTHSVISEGPCNKAAFRSFGTSISSSGDLLVVGAPLAKTGAPEHGKIFFYNYISATDTWTLNTTVGSPEDPAGSPDLQNGALFGNIVSVRTDPLGNAILLIGSPGYDGTNGTDSGKAYLYLWVNGTSTLTFEIAIEGENSGDAFGSAVTSNGVRFSVSAPNFDSPPFTDNGKVYLYDLTLTLAASITYTGGSLPIDSSANNHHLGVSLSLTIDDTLYMGGGAGVGAYATALIGIGASTSVTKIDNFPGTVDGDVSQASSGVAGLGYVGTGVDIYTDGANAVAGAPSYSILKAESDYGRDISVNGARLIVNGNDAPNVGGAGVAYAYYVTSCYSGGDLVANEWAMIGLQCDTGSATIDDIFTPDLGVYGPSGDWYMFKQNGSDYEGHQNAYVPMGSAEVMVQGQGYWIISGTDKSWTIPTSIGDAATQTPTEADPLSGQSGRDNVAAVHSIALKTMLSGLVPPATGIPDADIRVMFSNPYSTAMDWSNTLFRGTGGSFQLVVLATFFEDSDTSAYAYDASSGGYIAIAAGTPGMPREINAGEGFFVRFSNSFYTSVLQDSGVTTADFLFPLSK